jgi:hypothetical protein
LFKNPDSRELKKYFFTGKPTQRAFRMEEQQLMVSLSSAKRWSINYVVYDLID